MTTERRLFIEKHGLQNLTEEEKKKRYHFCVEWDGALIGEDDDEFKCCCRCFDMKSEDADFLITEHPDLGIVDVICKKCGQSLNRSDELQYHRAGLCNRCCGEIEYK